MNSIMLEESWKEVLAEELEKPYMASLAAFVREERLNHGPIYPPKEQVFSALNETPYDNVRVVIVGQDPYHGPGQAHGLCFSVPPGIDQPPSLKNIFKELRADLDIALPNHGCLLKWAHQGVLLLNTTLTVRQGQPLSHAKQGWEQFTDAIIKKVNQKTTPVIFVLWGRNAQEKCVHLDARHHVLKAAHPSPLSAHNGFIGCKHFSKINTLLAQPIDWAV